MELSKFIEIVKEEQNYLDNFKGEHFEFIKDLYKKGLFNFEITSKTLVYQIKATNKFGVDFLFIGLPEEMSLLSISKGSLEFKPNLKRESYFLGGYEQDYSDLIKNLSTNLDLNYFVNEFDGLFSELISYYGFSDLKLSESAIYLENKYLNVSLTTEKLKVIFKNPPKNFTFKKKEYLLVDLLDDSFNFSEDSIEGLSLHIFEIATCLRDLENISYKLYMYISRNRIDIFTISSLIEEYKLPLKIKDISYKSLVRVQEEIITLEVENAPLELVLTTNTSLDLENEDAIVICSVKAYLTLTNEYKHLNDFTSLYDLKEYLSN